MIIFQTPLNYWGTGLCFIQTKKSVLTPSQSTPSLPGLYIFNNNMILSLTDEKNITKEIQGKTKLPAEAKAEIQW